MKKTNGKPSTAIVRVGTNALEASEVLEGEIVEEPYERTMLIDGSVCDDNFFPGGPRTVREAKRLGPQNCPHLAQCQNGFLKTHHCTMRWGIEVAREALESGSLSAEMREFRREHDQRPWLTSDDRVTFRIERNDARGCDLVEAFAARLLEGHLPKGRAARVERTRGRTGTNGGRNCDVSRGPCSCGAWH